MSEWFDLAKQVVPPFLTGVLGVAGTWAATRRKEARDAARLLRETRALRDEVLELDRQLGITRDNLNGLLGVDLLKDKAVLLSSTLKEMTASLASRGTDIRLLQSDMGLLRASTSQLELARDELRNAVQRLDTSTATYTRENAEQWQDINRAIGRIEGILHSLQRRPSNDGFPSPTRPR